MQGCEGLAPSRWSSIRRMCTRGVGSLGCRSPSSVWMCIKLQLKASDSHCCITLVLCRHAKAAVVHVMCYIAFCICGNVFESVTLLRSSCVALIWGSSKHQRILLCAWAAWQLESIHELSKGRQCAKPSAGALERSRTVVSSCYFHAALSCGTVTQGHGAGAEAPHEGNPDHSCGHLP